MKGNLLIFVLALLLLTGIVGLAAYQYTTNEKVFSSYFQEHQFLHADHLSDQIKKLLCSYQTLLETTPFFGSNPRENVERLNKAIQSFSGRIGKDFISEISFYDDKGVTVYSTNNAAIGSYEGRSPFFSWASKPENRGKIFFSPAVQDPQIRSAQVKHANSGDNSFIKGSKIFLAIPIIDHAASEKTYSIDKLRGVLSLSVDLRGYIGDELKEDLISPAKVWIMDRDGRLLFHSHYPEKIGLNLLHGNEPATRLHASFPYVGEILEKGEGTFDYDIKGAPRELIGFSSMDFQNLSWIVVYSSPYESASAFVRKGLKQSLLLVGAVVFSFVLGFAYLMNNSRVKLRAEEESKHWQILMDERKKGEESLRRSAEQLRYLSSRLLTSQEEERQRISKELHDVLGGALVTLKLRENLVKKDLKPDQAEQIRECEKTIEYIDQIMQEVYRLIRNLSPSILEHLGLTAAIRKLVDDHAKRNSIKATVDAADTDGILSREAQRGVYRIFQEAFTNIEKYAQAANVSVVVRENEDQVSFLIKDDGKGFDPEKMGARPVTEKGLGLAIMQERVGILGGHFEIWSEEGKGTQISFRVPKTQCRPAPETKSRPAV